MSVTLTTMRYFVEVARHENFSIAARALYTAQSNLSKSISGLEKTLGVKLFLHEGRYVRLTNAGRFLYGEWSRALETIDCSILHARQMEQARRDVISIGILEGLDVTSGGPEWLEDLHRRSPDATFQLERDGVTEIWKKFDEGKFDMIVTCEFHSSPRALPPSCVRHVLNTQCGVIAINTRNPLAEHSALTLAMLRDESFVVLSQKESPEGYLAVREACRRAGFDLRITREAPSIETLLLYVELGAGAAILNGNSRLTSNPNIRLIPLEDILFDMSVYWHAGPSSPTLRVITDQFSTR